MERSFTDNYNQPEYINTHRNNEEFRVENTTKSNYAAYYNIIQYVQGRKPDKLFHELPFLSF